MGRLLDLWATGHRNGRALGGAVIVWALLGLILILKCQANRDPLLDVVSARGTVVEILGSDAAAPSASGMQLRQAVIMLADSTLIQLVLTPPLPAVGDGVPLVVEQFRSGKKSYSFDQGEWAVSGPR